MGSIIEFFKKIFGPQKRPPIKRMGAGGSGGSGTAVGNGSIAIGGNGGSGGIGGKGGKAYVFGNGVALDGEDGETLQ